MLWLGLDFFIGMTVSNILYLKVKHLLFTKYHEKEDTHVKALWVGVCTQPKWNTGGHGERFPICHILNSLYSANSGIVHNILNQYIALFSTGYAIHELLLISSWKYFLFPFLRKNFGAFFLRTSYCLGTANSQVAVLSLLSARAHKLLGSRQQKIHNRYNTSVLHI